MFRLPLPSPVVFAGMMVDYHSSLITGEEISPSHPSLSSLYLLQSPLGPSPVTCGVCELHWTGHKAVGAFVKSATGNPRGPLFLEHRLLLRAEGRLSLLRPGLLG